jgi:hypothetical protein
MQLEMRQVEFMEMPVLIKKLTFPKTLEKSIVLKNKN